MSNSEPADSDAPVRSRGPDRWYALYDAHAEAVWRLVARLIGSCRADVGDVVQETFMAASRGDVRFDSARGSERSWLCGIARRQVALYFRERRRSYRMLEDDPRGEEVRRQVLDWLDGRVERPEAELTRSETVAMVRHVIATLSELHSTVLIMRYLEELSVEDIARSEQCSVTAIRSRLARAREAFRVVIASRSPSTIDADTGAGNNV